jgi:hypothetical protein
MRRFRPYRFSRRPLIPGTAAPRIARLWRLDADRRRGKATDRDLLALAAELLAETGHVLPFFDDPDRWLVSIFGDEQVTVLCVEPIDGFAEAFRVEFDAAGAARRVEATPAEPLVVPDL